MTTSRVLTSGVNAASSYYNRVRERIDAGVARSPFLNSRVQAALAPVDFAAAFTTRVVGSAAALPGVIGDPAGAARSAIAGVARTIDNVLLDQRSIAQVGRDTYSLVANSSLRQISTAAGTITADVALAVGPKFIGGRISGLAQTGSSFERAAVTESLPTQLQANRATGAQFQELLERYQSSRVDQFSREVSIRPNTADGPADYLVRLDGIGIDRSTQELLLFEAKGSATAPLTRNQRRGFPLIERYGGTVVGRNGGTAAPAVTAIRQGSSVQVFRPGDIPMGY